MIEDNKHKFYAKSALSDGRTRSVLCDPRADSLNYSRSLGSTGHWFGCGYMHKDGKLDDHINLNFPFYSLVYIVQGEGVYVDAEGKSYTLTAGDIFQRQPGVVHSSHVKADSGWKEYYLDCNTELYQQLVSMSLIDTEISALNRAFDSAVTEEIESLIQLLKRSPQNRIYDAYLKFQIVLHLLFSERGEVSESGDMMEQSISDFDTAYAKRIDLKAYCLGKGWGYEKFRKAFRKHTGVSPRDYLVRKRLDEACRLLRSSRKQISEISAELGYSSQYEFSNQFKKYFHVFPKHYRDGI